MYTNLGNDVKIDDLTEISSRYNIGLIITLDESAEENSQSKTSEHQQPIINEHAAHYNFPIKEQFRSFLARQKSASTATSYTSTLDNAVREWINKEVDEHADSVFSYTSSDDVRLCIDMLKNSIRDP